MKFFDLFFSFLKSEKRYSHHTIVAYQTDLTQFSEFVSKTYELDTIDTATSQVVRSWVVDLIEQGLDNKSVNRKISTLKSYYRFLTKEGVIQQSPMGKVVSPKVGKKLPFFVPEKDMEFLFEDLEFEPGFVGSRDQLMLDLFYSTGIRRDELINLKLTDIDYQAASIKVTGKRNKERIIPVHQRLINMMQDHVAERALLASISPFLFLTEKGEKIYPRLVYRLVNKYLEKVTTVKKKSPHILRHTFATHMLNNGADLNSIKELLGHVNLSATQVYTHNSMEKIKRIYKQAHPKA